MFNKGGFVYIVCSPNRSTLYAGVTSDLKKRIHEHRIKFYPNSFSARYNCVMLVYYQFFNTIDEAIMEEKRIKAGSRKEKERLIQSINEFWKDLWDEIERW